MLFDHAMLATAESSNRVLLSNYLDIVDSAKILLREKKCFSNDNFFGIIFFY